ncbi:MAG: hypothetical protein WC827_02995 [Candidatus Paceibacterota bacterium]|jgi:hypothetical protein
MKYKKQIATGVLTLSLLVGGSFVFAETLRDLGIKNFQFNYQKNNKDNKKVKNIKRNNTIGIVSSINENGFILETKNIKNKEVSSIDIKTDASTIYNKNGLEAKASNLTTGQKVIITGTIDKTANTIIAQKIRIITKNFTKNR